MPQGIWQWAREVPGKAAVSKAAAATIVKKTLLMCFIAHSSVNMVCKKKGVQIYLPGQVQEIKSFLCFSYSIFL